MTEPPSTHTTATPNTQNRVMWICGGLALIATLSVGWFILKDGSNTTTASTPDAIKLKQRTSNATTRQRPPKRQTTAPRRHATRTKQTSGDRKSNHDAAPTAHKMQPKSPQNAHDVAPKDNTNASEPAVAAGTPPLKKDDKPTPKGESFEYKDPTNKRVLGPSTWMAQPTKEKAKEINDALDNSPAAAELEKNKRRANAHRAVTLMAKEAQLACLKKWPLPTTSKNRRMIVNIDMEQRVDRARIRKATTSHVIGITSQSYLTCITTRLYNATIDEKIPMWMTTQVPLTF